jgi:hypothetical protein
MNRTRHLIGMYGNLILANVTTTVPLHITFLVLGMFSPIGYVTSKD